MWKIMDWPSSLLLQLTVKIGEATTSVAEVRPLTRISRPQSIDLIVQESNP